MKSLLLKLGMVTVTIGIVGWIGWPLHGPHQSGVSPPERQDVTTTASKHLDYVSQPSVQPALHGQASTLAAQGQTGTIKFSVDRLLDLNRANADELEALPGIGAVLAQRVIAFRQSAGGFRTIEDLRAVKGIGAKKFDRLKSLVTVSAKDQKNTTEQQML